MDALSRILGAPLAVDIRGDSVRVVVAADKYTVARISGGVNDREGYARLFAASVEMLATLIMVRDADDDCRRDDIQQIPPAPRARIDAAIAAATGWCADAGVIGGAA